MLNKELEYRTIVPPEAALLFVNVLDVLLSVEE